MQANIDLQVNPQPALLCPGETFIGLKPLPGIHQPLQLLFWPEAAGTGCELLIETVNGGHRKRLAHQYIRLRQGLGHGVKKGLVEDHQPVAAGGCHDPLQKRQRRQ